MDHIEWTIPGNEAQAADFGPLVGQAEAWGAMERALFDGWVVAVTSYPNRRAFDREFRAQAKAAYRTAHIHVKDSDTTTLFVWWS